MNVKDELRFLDKVRVADGCWTWTGSHTAGGYSQFYLDGRMLYAHRVAYELHIGSIESGREIHHTCCNKGCVNPEHLELVTHLEHTQRDKKAPRKAVCLRGHDLMDPENLYESGGRRWCKLCAQARNRRWQRERNGHSPSAKYADEDSAA